MRTYRDLFAAPEFTPLFAACSLQVAAQTVGGLALGSLVYARTGSPLLSALAMFGPALAQVVGALTLLSAADRLPPRAVLAGLSLFLCLATLLQTAPGLPTAAALTLVLLQGVPSALGGGVRYGLLTDILDKGGYLLGRSVLNMSSGICQIAGYALGGVLVTALSPRGTLLIAAGLYVLSAAVVRGGLGARPARAAGRPSLRETMRGNALLWSSVPRRYVYLALWVPNGLIVGCEALFVPYDTVHAGVLLASASLGMLAGDILTGRFLPPRLRARLGAPLRLLLAAPYLVFGLRPSLPVALAAVAVASIGFSASLLLQERLVALTPDELSGHALGLHTAGMLTMQGVGALLAGALAQLTSPAAAMVVLAVLSVAVTLVLGPGLRSPVSARAGDSTCAA
ncbi:MULTISPECIES: MFS transporter [unclassified Streptomyces]|uniref:MFS transporter n=1 Tax=unclassified Streptomyces TaxID=2593676 RepID=UPI000DB9D858|nr:MULTISPECIES: MFS transporter [unclassified Streptomyces]MYT75737.1 MFS transporter [Streptomyces sp. SID8367]RAJ87146.1 putative MFS family arabinose efflux permease [Streptomyces sp. PsTaAH-137]